MRHWASVPSPRPRAARRYAPPRRDAPARSRRPPPLDRSSQTPVLPGVPARSRSPLQPRLAETAAAGPARLPDRAPCLRRPRRAGWPETGRVSDRPAPSAPARATAAGRTWRRHVRSAVRFSAQAGPAAAPKTDRRRRIRLRARTRNRRGQAARCALKLRSQTPARMQRHDPTGEHLPVDAGKTSGADHVRERVGFRKFADGLDEVLVGFGIAGHGAAKLGDHLEGKEFVETIKPGYVDGGKFQAEKSPARPQHTECLVKRQIDPRHIADAEGDGVAVERAVGEA